MRFNKCCHPEERSDVGILAFFEDQVMSRKRYLKNMSSLLVNNFISVFYYLGRQSEPSSDKSLVGCCSLLALGRQSEPYRKSNCAALDSYVTTILPKKRVMPHERFTLEGSTASLSLTNTSKKRATPHERFTLEGSTASLLIDNNL